MDWVIEKIKVGYVDVINPFNQSQISRISLKSEDIKCWMWWSKDFEEWIKYYKSYENIFNTYKGHCFQFTINSPSELERNLTVSLEKRFEQLKWIIKTFGTLSINYRYDPIIFYKNQGSEEIKNNLDKFEYIIERVSSLGINNMIFSFATLYPKVEKRMIARGKIPLHINLNKKKEITLNLLEICEKYNVQMNACCQPDLLNIKGIEQAHCIDAYKIEKLIGESILKVRDTGQRKECGCYKSKDIGGYKGIFRCKHSCDYCYASPSQR
jgi:DNA repair photolyase